MGFKFSGDSRFSDGILRVNDSDAPNADAPSSFVGFAVHRGAAAGVFRELAGLFWDETNQSWVGCRLTSNDQVVAASEVGVRFKDAEFTGVLKTGTTGITITNAAGNLLAPQLSGALPAIDGSSLTGVAKTGSGQTFLGGNSFRYDINAHFNPSGVANFSTGANASVGFTFVLVDTLGATNAIGLIRMAKVGSWTSGTLASQTSHIIFEMADGGNQREVQRFVEGGRVLVGQTTDDGTSRLQIGGTLKTSGLVIAGSGAIAITNAAGNLLASTLTGTVPDTVILPIATTSQLGGVKVDGTTILASGDGTLSLVGGAGAGTSAADEGLVRGLHTKNKKMIASLDARTKLLESKPSPPALDYIVVAIGAINWTPGVINNGAGVTAGVSAPGAVFGDQVEVTAPDNLAGLILHGYIEAANSFITRLDNNIGASVTAPAGVYKYRIIRW